MLDVHTRAVAALVMDMHPYWDRTTFALPRHTMRQKMASAPTPRDISVAS